MKEKDKLIYIESLGCNKNTVDSEVIVTILKSKGYKRTFNPSKASSIIVNTCTFIDEAKAEAINTIIELSQLKAPGSKLIVTGCFPQLYHKEIINEMPEVDAVLGVGDLSSIIEAAGSDIRRDYPESRALKNTYKEYPFREEFLTFKGYAYVKIAEGCSKNCSFCLIPRIKGEQRSREIKNIVDEVNQLELRGIKEIILTSQDTLSYGRDIGYKNGLKDLVDSLIKNTNIKYIRLLYLRPDDELIKNLQIFDNERVIPYFDIPIQHISKMILKEMNRWGDIEYYKDIVSKIRKTIYNAILRTSIIVGFPGETEDDFKQLMQFILENQFDHIGVFTFSAQRETEAYKLKGGIKKKTALERKDKILEIQKDISKRRLEQNTGKVFDVLIEEKFKNNNLYFGRSYHFAPDVDGVFVVKSNRDINPGEVVKAKVSWTDYYDLHGVEINMHSNGLY